MINSFELIPPPIPFQVLQAQLRARWRNVQEFDNEAADIVVIPSLSLDQRELLKVAGFHHYEERLLFSLIRLRNPRTRLIYLTSQPLHPSIIDYYLQLLPGIPFSHARDRLLLLSTYDGSLKSLTQKILDRPRLLERIRQAVNSDRAYMICYNATNLERDLSEKLGIPLFASDPALLEWGTKSGSRAVFEASGIPFPDGSPLVHSAAELAEAAADVWGRNPEVQRLVVKLNEGFSGEGNAILDLRGLQAHSPSDRVAQIRNQLPHLQFEAAGEQWETYCQQVEELGAIAEVFIEGEEKYSPSVQARITPSGDVEILSTHDQILGGPTGQMYLGCRFPADAAYRMQLQAMGERVGEVLAQKGVLERFGVDFVTVRQGDEWKTWAIEINLRKGGTTHPFMTLKFLTNGFYDGTTGLFHSRHRQVKYYMATDNLQSPQYRGLLPNDLMDIVANHQLHFDTSTETGTVFHLMGCLSEFGKLGVTSIGDSPEEAEAIYRRVVQVLDQETCGDRSPCQEHYSMYWHR
ncbi:peptide ligase PGM1-related protein [Alkalinema sp. FACHB-956]|uniref:peptide ligase PGM1-related protein n=1 Tax=Alkalinema sp. FACHB-956 TaxID=2692768 RepID=UPI001689B548|nr:peptide ligase PGM1-related protein [Alkalinema sp. FACHB-956]MBD2327711.1 carboxylate-amine ligase [Alkalinema sp. FACHB-956]